MPSDTDRVRAWFEGGTLLRPEASLPNSVDLARALAALAGVRHLELTANARAIAGRIGPAGHVVFVLVDGLGMNLIESLPAGSFLRRHAAMELRAVFPPTTAAALTSLATGLWPAQHAVPSWWAYLRERDISATVLPFVERFTGQPLQELGVEPASVFTQPSLMGRFAAGACSFLPAQIADSAYTRYVTCGTRVSGYEKLGDALDAVAQRIVDATAPTYTYVYFPTIDSAEHQHGPDGDVVHALVAYLELYLERLASRLDGRARIVVSADHGVLHVPRAGQHALKASDPLLDLLLAPPSGEPRVPFFHVRPGSFDAFASQFRERSGEAFALLTTDEAEALELFGPGPLSPLARDRIGDAIALSAEPAVLLYEKPMPYLGFHAGLSPDEVRVPLLIA